MSPKDIEREIYRQRLIDFVMHCGGLYGKQAIAYVDATIERRDAQFKLNNQEMAMSNETDLDWLARNVHAWCQADDAVAVVHDGEFIFSPQSKYSARGINRDQWLARRAELQNKPSWSGSPEWAQFLGQDANGVWYWYGERPNEKGEDVNGRRYWMPRGISDIACRGELLGDWRSTLEKRPYLSATNCTVTSSGSFGVTVGAPAYLSEQAVTTRLQEATDNVLAAVPELKSDKYKFDQLTSIEDNREQEMTPQQDMKQDNGWFERGELPPVGFECEMKRINGRWCKAVTVGKDSGGRMVCELNDNGVFYASTSSAESFRHIRTERDLAIDEMKQYCPHHEIWNEVGRMYAEAIYDAGYRKEPN